MLDGFINSFLYYVLIIECSYGKLFLPEHWSTWKGSITQTLNIIAILLLNIDAKILGKTPEKQIKN